MVVKVKKNKTPKKSKGKKSTMLQKQTVSQNVKVNIYKEPRKSKIPKEFKVATQKGKGAVPNIKELPASVFHQPVFRPTLTLYNETFGDATRQIRSDPFERQLTSLAVQDNRELENATLRNTLESSRLKAVEREPIQQPFLKGDSEEDRFMKRATASTDDNREPFRVVDVNDATTLGVSRKDRLTEGDKLEMAEKRLARFQPFQSTRDRFKAPPDNIRSSLEQAVDEATLGRSNTGVGESDAFRTQGGNEAEDYTIVDTQQSAPDHNHSMPLGEPSIPNRLVSFVAETGTAGDFLREQRGEYAPETEGQIDAEQIAVEAKKRGRRITRHDAKSVAKREATSASRQRAKSLENAPALKPKGRPKKALVEGQKTMENFMGSNIGGS